MHSSLLLSQKEIKTYYYQRGQYVKYLNITLYNPKRHRRVYVHITLNSFLLYFITYKKSVK